MKTRTEIKFEKVIKEGFQDFLKPFGFKKKGNNFYINRSELGQLVNVQKSYLYSKDHIHFTVNTGIFLSEHWSGLIYNQGKVLPQFPSEVGCLIRKRIGEIKNQNDIWYDLNEQVSERILIEVMQENLQMYIMPYFEVRSTKDQILSLFSDEKAGISLLDKLIVFAELNHFEKASEIYYELSKEVDNQYFINIVNEYAIKYGLI